MAEQQSDRKSRGRPRSPFTDTSASTIQALERGLVVLKTLAREGDQTLTELSLRLGMPASTLHRILITLETQEFTRLIPDTQTWGVGVEAFRTGSRFLRQTNLLESGRPAMRGLVDQTGETANLAIPDQTEVVFIGQVETDQPIRAFFRPGSRGAMHASGIGKALLAAMPRAAVERILRKTGLPGFTDKSLTSADSLFADLDAIAKRGWSVDDEERHLGMRCVAATIFDSFGEPIGGISVSGPSARLDINSIAQFGPLVRDAAARVSADIGGGAGVV